MDSRQQQVNPERIMKVAWGFGPPILVDTAIQVGLFDALDAKPQTAGELAELLKISRRGATALADALTGIEFLHKDGEGRYSLAADAAAFLVRGKPAFHGGSFAHTTRDLIPNWLQLPKIVRTGEPVRQVETHEDSAAFFEEFVEALFTANYGAAKRLAEHLELNRLGGEVSVLDLAAGSGVWSIALAQSCPRVQATAVDWEAVLKITRRTAEKFGLGKRFRYVAGDVATADFGNGHAVATLGHILHSEGRESSKALLKRVHEALAPGGIIAIAEFVPNAERTGPPMPLMFGVNMLVHTTEGDIYSFEEMREWLIAAGYGNVRQLEVPGPSPLVLADKA